MEVSAPAPCQHDISDLRHTGNGTVNLWFVGCTHQHLMFVSARKETVVDEVGLEVHAGELYHGFAAHGIIRPRYIDKGALVSAVSPDISLENDLCFGNEHPVPAPFHRNFATEQLGRIRELHPVGYPGAACECDCRVRADGDRYRETFAIGKCLSQHDVRMPALDEAGGNPVLVQHEHAVDGGVCNTAIAGKDNACGDVLPCVIGEMMHDRNFCEIGLFHRHPAIFNHRSLVRGTGQLPDNLAFINAEGKGECTPVRRHVHDSPCALQIVKEEHLIGRTCHLCRLHIGGAGLMDVDKEPASPHRLDELTHRHRSIVR